MPTPGLRVVHNLIQATWNKIEVRFSVFLLSTIALIGMIAIAGIAVASPPA